MGLGHDPSQDGRRPPGARRITDPKPTPCDRWPGCGCTLQAGVLAECERATAKARDDEKSTR